MRIKRTYKNFTVRRKADRQIHYAGQEKKYTKNTMNLSIREKQDVLRQENLSGAGLGIKIQKQSNIDTGMREINTDDTGKSYQQEYREGSDNRSGDFPSVSVMEIAREL